MAGSRTERLRSRRATAGSERGSLVFSMYRYQAFCGDTLTVSWVRSTRRREQRLHLATDQALLRVNGIAASAVVLRAHVGPQHIDVSVVSPTHDTNRTAPAPDGASPIEIVLWNSWVVEGVEHAWVGDAGMRLEGVDPLRLACNDGFADTDFGDLIVEIAGSSGHQTAEENL